MEAKKATLITISSIIIAAGTIGLIIRAQKKRLYSAILTKIIQASPVRNSDWQAYFDINFHKAYNPAQYSKYTTFNAQKIAEKLRDTFYGEWYQLGMGTKEDEMYALLSQIPDGVRLSQVSDEYQKKYEANLLSEIRSELDVKNFDKVVEIVSRKKKNSRI